MSTKQLLPVPIFTAANMGATLTSPTIEIEWLDNIALHFAWAGTPTGTFTVNVSLNPTVLGWQTLTLSGLAQPAGGAGSNFIDINQTAAAYIQLVYTRSSGTGILNCYLAGKSV